MATAHSHAHHRRPLLDPPIVRRALWDAVIKLDPRIQVRNPVMFTVLVGSVATTLLFFERLVAGGGESPWFVAGVSLWLWFTVLFANFAEAMAEGRGKAQADALKATRQNVTAKKLLEDPGSPKVPLDFQHLVKLGEATFVAAPDLRQGDVVLVEAGDQVPGDGEVIAGCASVDESAITGESAPVIRESGGDKSSVTGGTRVLSDWLIVRITANPGESFLDRMIGLVEGARRQKTPNEIALSILLSGFTIIFLLVCATLLPFSLFSVAEVKNVDPNLLATPITVTVLIALLVCLIPTT